MKVQFDMFKEEVVFRELLCRFLARKEKVSQAQLSTELGISIGLVNKTVVKLARIGAVRVNRRSLAIIDYNRILIFWSTMRNIDRDIAYSTRVELPIREIERSIPDGAFFTAYTAVKLTFSNSPSDYSEVWLYADDPTTDEIKRRFPKNNLTANLIVLRSDLNIAENVSKYSANKNCATLPQIYVDLWNIPTWYSREFISYTGRRIEETSNAVLE